LTSLQLTSAVMAADPIPGDYKALVCIFLYGGNDSFNMLMPYDTAEYDDYLSIRYAQNQSGLAIPHDDLLMIGDTNSARNFGLHPSMSGLQSLYNEGKVAFVANVGSLVEPTDRTAYDNDINLPLGLYSHSDFTRHWQTSVPQTRTHVTGWGGRMADILTDPAAYNDAIGMSISVGDVNLLQTGANVYPYVVNVDGATLNEGYRYDWGPDIIFRRSFNDALGRTHANLVTQTYADATSQAIEAAQLYNDATEDVSLTTEFPSNYLGQQLQRVARTIGAAGRFGKSRQIFFVNIGGFDNHADLIGPHGVLMDEVSSAMSAFYAATEELGVASNVTSFTVSDFARTLAGNGQGSDHGWGGNQIVMGGAVNGGGIYGQYPMTLAANDPAVMNNPLDVYRGILIPTTSVDQFNAEMAMWFGIANNADLVDVLPNIRNFFPAGGAQGPLGFL
tara:strand:+ start:74097 stop:75437 length:1341 start_codon:yes stop_codon:yes gene_type:complete